jgi:ABC-type lipoprotein export system ATPase subunit
MIRLEDVSKIYRTAGGAVQAVNGITLAIPPGQFVAVRGPSGCGKSTLLSLVGGLAAATSGRVTVAGEDIGAMSPAARAAFRASRIGFVFQTFHLLPYLRVEDNVALAATPGQTASAAGRVRDLLARFRLDHRLGHRPAELSTGECQRVAIARALLNRPPLLLADEPTGNLDSQSAEAVLELIGAYHREGGTVVLVTHQDWVSECAERVVMLHDGQLVSPCGTA